MKIFIASDHAGFALKQHLLIFLSQQGYEAEDAGPAALVEGDDYPDTIAPLVAYVQGNPGSFGIAIGGSGQGEAMVCNREKGIRAIVFYGGPLDIVKLGREHNDANVLSFGARFITEKDAERAVLTFVTTPFSNDERHIRRIQKLG